VFPFAGFWSKDELLVVANETGHLWLFIAFVVTAGLTAFYTTRMVMLTFFGTEKEGSHAHESSPSMTGPLVFLAACTTFVGLLGAPQFGAVFGQWVFYGAIEEAVFVPWVALVGSAMALGGIFVGYRAYRVRKARDPLEAMGTPMWNLLQNRYYIDSFYMRDIVYPIRDRWSAGVYWFNQNVLDAVVDGAAVLTRGVSTLVSWFDRNVIDGFVNALGSGAEEGGGLLKYIQSGNVQWYAVGLFVGVIALTIVFVRIA
jgi:NADH-quinone oxidoreductase subunit L